MAFTKVVGAGIHTLSNITSHNINSSGIITATKFVGPFDGTSGTFSGNVTIGGNLSVAQTVTYEDVKNVDSVGVGTFREGIFIPDTKRIHIGDAAGSGDLQLFHHPNNSFVTNDTGQLNIQSYQTFLRNVNGSKDYLKATDGYGVELYNNGLKKFETTSSGVSIGGTTIITNASGGKLGIGTAAPDGTLTIHGFNGGNPGLTLRRDSSGGDIASIAWATNSASYAKINYRDAAPHGLQFYSGGTASSNLSMIIRHNGNIGIGSEIPTDKLDIQTGSSDEVTKFKVKTQGQLELTRNHSDAPYIKTFMNSGNPAIHLGDSGGDKTIIHGHGNSYFNGGYVGVNRSTPSANLHISNNELAAGTDPAGAAAPNATYDGLVVDGSNASFINIRSRGNGSPSYGRVSFSDDVRSRGYVEYRHEDGSFDDELRFATAGSVQLIIDKDGNIGVNESDPSEKLQIDGDILLGGQANASESNYAIKFEYNNHQFAKIVGDGRDQSGYGDIDFYTSSGSGVSNLTQRMSIRADGKIGIGDFTSATPDSMLHINGISATAQIRLQRTNAAANTNDYGRIYFESNSNVLTGEISVARYSAENDGYMHFNTATGGTLYERLRITSTGAVTISGNRNQIAPTEYDDITGTNQAGLLIGSSGLTDAGIVLRTGASGTGRIYFGDNSGSDAGRKSGQVSYYHNGDFMIFATADTERVRIDNEGKSLFKKDAGSTNNSYSIVAELNAKTSGSAAAGFGPALYLSHTFGGTNYAGSLIISETNSDVNTTDIVLYPRNYGWSDAASLRIDNSGRVMFGTSSPGVATGDEFTIHTAAHTGMTIRSGSSHEGNIFFADGDAGSAGIIRYEHNNNAMVFKTNSTGQERLRIDSNGNVKVVARGSNTSGAPFYVAVTGKSDISYAGGNDDTACLRIVDNGSNNSYYHGLELRSRQGADVRLYCQDQGNDLSHFVIATDNSALLERARFTQYGMQLQPYTTDSANSGYPISTFTDGGTRFATHLATMSGYSGDGEIIVITQFGDHSSGSEMFSVRITGYWYSNSVGGAIDCVVGAYAGEGSYHNASVTGTYPVNWRDKIKFASITSGNNQGKMCIRLGAVGASNDCELAFTDCTHGFYGVNQSKTSGWRVIKVNDQNTINNTYNGTVRTAVHRSNSFHNDEFTVHGSGTGELLTNRPGQGGTIMGMYQYTQYNQGFNFNHLIRSPSGHTDLTDSYCDRNWMALISASVDGTSTVDTGTTYFCRDNSDDNNSLQISHHLGYSGSGNSNRVNMVIDNGRVAWRMQHSSAYRISVTVQFLAGGKQNGTYNTADTSYQGN